MADIHDRNVDRTNGVRVGAWINVALGLVLMAIPFFTLETGAAFWNNIIVGLLVLALAGYNAWAASRGAAGIGWASGVNAMLGIWVIVSPFLFGTGTAHLWADVVVGAILALVAAYNAWAIAAARPVGPGGRPGI